jgi:hypothetical protein
MFSFGRKKDKKNSGYKNSTTKQRVFFFFFLQIPQVGLLARIPSIN